jgi:hypothetical protein
MEEKVTGQSGPYFVLGTWYSLYLKIMNDERRMMNNEVIIGCRKRKRSFDGISTTWMEERKPVTFGHTSYIVLDTSYLKTTGEPGQ